MTAFVICRGNDGSQTVPVWYVVYGRTDRDGLATIAVERWNGMTSPISPARSVPRLVSKPCAELVEASFGNKQELLVFQKAKVLPFL